jgi:hypothetical protein
MVEKRDGESQDERMKKVEQGIKDIQKQLALGFGFAVLAAALAIALSVNSLKGDFGVIPLVVLIVILMLGGYAIMVVSGGMSILDVPDDATQAKRGSRAAQVVRILLWNSGVVLAFAGSSIRHWSPTAGDWVAVVGLIGFTAGLALVFAAKKSSNAALPPHLKIDP